MLIPTSGVWSGSCTIPFLSWPAIQFPTTPYRKLDVRESGFGI
jgi:hypothetical protein